MILFLCISLRIIYGSSAFVPLFPPPRQCVQKRTLVTPGSSPSISPAAPRASSDAIAGAPYPPSGSRHSLDVLASRLSNGSFRNVLVLIGAGASVSAGIPDFRSPGTGLYDNLSHYNLPYPEAIFEVDFYKRDPRPFVTLVGELWPGQEGGPIPTPSHHFLRVLQEEGILRRCYTQNIDGLESLAGVVERSLVECHGGFRSASCTECGSTFDISSCREKMVRKEIVKCACGGYVKPDVVFFGEELPLKFQDLIDEDLRMCDLLIVMGTSLKINPVASIPKMIPKTCPRLLINREIVGDFEIEDMGFEIGTISRKRDIFVKGDCDDGVRKICDLAGWRTKLDKLCYGDVFPNDL